MLLIVFSSCSDDNQNDVDEDNLNKEIENAQLSEFSGFYFVGNYAGNLLFIDMITKPINTKYFGILMMNA